MPVPRDMDVMMKYTAHSKNTTVCQRLSAETVLFDQFGNVHMQMVGFSGFSFVFAQHE